MNDFISRKKLLEQIKADSEGREGQYGDEWLFIDTINAIPTAEPKVGKWIKNEHGLKCCSVCGKRPLQICYYNIYLDGYDGKDILSKYCPHCGAKMFGLDTEDDK